MPNRVRQYETSAKIGVMGAIKEGLFAIDGSGEEAIPNMYVRQAIAQGEMMMHGGGDDSPQFDYATGTPVEQTANEMYQMWRVRFRLPVTPEDGEVIVKFSVPSYIRETHCGQVYLSGANFDTVEHSPVTGNTAAYLDPECTKYLNWTHDPYYGDYFIAPDFLYFKMKAGPGGSENTEMGGKPTGFSMLYFDFQYAAKANLSIYQ